MIRLIAILAMLLLANTLVAQDPNSTLPAKCECNCAERLAKLEARIAALEAKSGTVVAAPQKKVRIVSWVKCTSCPKIKAWATPQLLAKGFVVENVMVDRAEVNKIYPYFEFCNDTTCVTVMVPNVSTPLTREWLEREMVAKGIK